MKSNFPLRREGRYSINGKSYISVTTILQAIDKPALRNWLAKEAARLVISDPQAYDTAEKAVSALSARKDSAADRGTSAHQIAANFCNGTLTDSNKQSPYYESIAAFFEMAQPRSEMVEQTVYNETHGYAGTVDLVAILPDEKRWLIDWKTSKAVYPEYALQVAAYAAAEFTWTPYLSPLAGGQSAPFPKVDKTAVVLLRDNGEFDFKAVTGDLDAFLAAKRVWEWLHNEG